MSAAIGVSLMTRGRPAWIASIMLGIILAVVGGLTGPMIFLIVAGAAFFLFGLVMLIISLVTKGRSD
jgi:hypothetical protein